jgi:hypothetical protein
MRPLMDGKFPFRGVITWAIALLVLGCAPDPRDIVDYSNEPIGLQLQRAEPSLKGEKYYTLLDFESADDTVFVESKPAAQQDSRHAHTGKASAAIGTSAKINLGSVLAGQNFPGDWTLVGGYVWSERPTTVHVHCRVGSAEVQNTVESPGGKWTPAFVDLTQLPHPAASDDVSLSFESSQPILCDDVMMIDNTKWYVSGPDSPWSIKRHGFKIYIDREGWFSMTLDTAGASRTGWSLQDASTMRATFSSAGETKNLTLYSDGRAFWDGRFEPISANAKNDAGLAESHTQPGEMRVADGMGRANRNTPGDANNDGYNETLGAYELNANGPRMELTMVPHGATLVRPLLEIAGLPPGKPLVTLEGRLVESLARVNNGNVLIEIPARIERPTTLNVRVENP